MVRNQEAGSLHMFWIHPLFILACCCFLPWFESSRSTLSFVLDDFETLTLLFGLSIMLAFYCYGDILLLLAYLDSYMLNNLVFLCSHVEKHHGLVIWKHFLVNQGMNWWFCIHIPPLCMFKICAADRNNCILIYCKVLKLRNFLCELTTSVATILCPLFCDSARRIL